MQDLLDSLSTLEIDYNVFFSVLAIISIVIIYLIVERILEWFIKANEYVILDDISSGIKFFTRFIAGYFIIVTIIYFYNLPPEFIILLTALLGTIISLSSIQVINNFLAGFVIILLRPYRANDFINLGSYEGRVTRITLNYTKILTINDVFVLVPNRYALKADLINYSIEQKVKKDQHHYLSDVKDLLLPFDEKKVTRYSFSIAIPLDNLKKSLSDLKAICQKNTTIFGFEPSFFLINVGYKVEYQFVLKSRDSEVIRTNLKSFRNQILKTVYSN
ncbi:MAG: mechanosensitive ion channel domain-containing protein [Candidatus Hodarchaeales archaeon]